MTITVYTLQSQIGLSHKMLNNEGLIETLAPAVAPAVARGHQGERRRPGRPDHVLPSLFPMLRDPIGAIGSNGGMAIKARLMALTVMCLCLALGYAMRGMH